MKSNYIKYIFFILVIIIVGVAVYAIYEDEANKAKNQIDKNAEQTSQTIKDIRLAVVNFDNINPLISKNRSVQEVTKLVFEPLLQLNKNYKLEKTQSLPILKLAKLKDYEFPLSKENKLQLSSKIYLYTYKFNPNITQFSKIGDFYLFSENKIICKIDIILSNKLEKNSCIYYFKNIFYNISHYF